MDFQAVVDAALDWLELSNDRPRFRQRICGVIYRFKDGRHSVEDMIMRERLAHLTPAECKIRHDEVIELLAVTAEAWGIDSTALSDYTIRTGEYEKYEATRAARVLVQRLCRKAKAEQAKAITSDAPPPCNFPHSEISTEILKVLSESRVLLTRNAIATKINRDPKTLTPYLKALREAGFIHRPNGDRSGEQITDLGRRELARIEETSALLTPR